MYKLLDKLDPKRAQSTGNKEPKNAAFQPPDRSISDLSEENRKLRDEMPSLREGFARALHHCKGGSLA